MGRNESTYGLSVPAELKKQLDRAAALLGLDDWIKADTLGSRLVINYAEVYVKGKTKVVFCTPEEKSLRDNHPDFFKALCQEGVIEWLTPFVMGKSIASPDENQ